MKRIWTVLLAGTLLASSAAPAAAITRGGVPDGEDHPYVGLMVAGFGDAEDFQPAWRCSGALISPTVYVTAGHCTDGAEHVEIWFDTDPQAYEGRLGYPFPSEHSVSGTPSTHPDYDDAAFYLYDLGVVVLDAPYQLDRYATLPDVGAVDELRPGRKSAVVTSVGYGLQAVKPKLLGALTRYRADLMVVDTTGVAGLRQAFQQFEGSGSFTVSGDAKHGGTCFGDSGGPVLLAGTDTLLGVNSFALNANCAGVGGVYRIDKQPDLAFISSFLEE
jgi:hypothetical protein